jgi:lysophospholipase L1-like esterase
MVSTPGPTVTERPALLVVVATFAAAAALLAGPSDRAPRHPPLAPGRIRPTPLVSRGARVVASSGGAGVLTDGRFRAEAWGGGHPTPERPAWVALQLPAGLSRVLVSWTSSHNHDLFERFYGAPADYRLETSADSTDGRDGSWRVEVSVTGNPARTRLHALALGGRRWVRLVVTGLPREVNQWGLFLDEIEVHDASGGGDDCWLFLGDSITAGVFDRAPDHQPDFVRWVEAFHPGYSPVMVNGGLPRLRSWEVAGRVDEVLALFPDAHLVAVTVGSNDGDLDRLRVALHAIVDRIRAAGRIPLLARIPFATVPGADYVVDKNRVLDEVVREEGLVPGPDLYGWFEARPQLLHDGLHPGGRGSADMQRRWAVAAAPLYPP